MKKIIVMVLVIALTLTAFAGCGNNTELEAKVAELQGIIDNSKVYPNEPFTSASKPQAKYDLGVTPQELADMGYNFKGTYLFITTNPDGTPNAGYMIYSVVKSGDKFYITQDASRHQTGANLLREKGGLAVWAANYNSEGSLMEDKVDKNPKQDPTITKNWSTRGIKMTLKLNEDPAVRTALKLAEGTYAYEIVSYIPLG